MPFADARDDGCARPGIYAMYGDITEGRRRKRRCVAERLANAVAAAYCVRLRTLLGSEHRARYSGAAAARPTRGTTVLHALGWITAPCRRLARDLLTDVDEE
jgi:hypothetical protein